MPKTFGEETVPAEGETGDGVGRAETLLGGAILATTAASMAKLI